MVTENLEKYQPPLITLNLHDVFEVVFLVVSLFTRCMVQHLIRR